MTNRIPEGLSGRRGGLFIDPHAPKSPVWESRCAFGGRRRPLTRHCASALPRCPQRNSGVTMDASAGRLVARCSRIAPVHDFLVCTLHHDGERRILRSRPTGYGSWQRALRRTGARRAGRPVLALASQDGTTRLVPEGARLSVRTGRLPSRQAFLRVFSLPLLSSHHPFQASLPPLQRTLRDHGAVAFSHRDRCARPSRGHFVLLAGGAALGPARGAASRCLLPGDTERSPLWSDWIGKNEPVRER